MFEDNFDDWATFCGDKDFYDVDGDGHLDWLEAGMMVADVDDEIEEMERRTPVPSNYTSAPRTERSGSFYIIMWLSIIFWVIELIADARKGIVDPEGTLGGVLAIIAVFAIHAIWKAARERK